MFLRWVTALYLVYLVVPIALLLVGSFGELWLNTLLPAGATVRWYEAVATDPSFQRAFVSSLAVATLTCAANAVIGLPLAYALFRTDNKRVRALTRVLYQLPVALPALVLAFGFILVFSSDALPWLGSIWLLAAGHVVLTLQRNRSAATAGNALFISCCRRFGIRSSPGSLSWRHSRSGNSSSQT